MRIIAEPDSTQYQMRGCATGQLRIDLEIRKRDWRWEGHNLRKADTAIGKKALEWSSREAGVRGRPCGNSEKNRRKRGSSSWEGQGTDGQGPKQNNAELFSMLHTVPTERQ